MRARTNIGLKDRRTLQLSNFRGVDFSSSPLSVRSDRASNMRNFINEYGVNKKRNGWNELIKIYHQGVPQRINGIFEYVNGSHRETLVHAGTRFYRLKVVDGKYSSEDITLSSTYAEAKCQTALIKDQRSQAFFSKGRAYIVGCGDYLVYGTWDEGSTYELRRVADNIDTYIPTTTISIDTDDVADDIRASLDDINCLSSKRINQLVGQSEANKTWTLDSGEIDEGTAVSITLETLEGEEGEEIAVSYTITNDGTKLYKTHKDGEEITRSECGSIDYATGKVTFSIPTTPQISERDNIFVTFTHKNEDYAKRIMNCNFGILFGVDGNTDRLFLSGNSDYPNIDFHSEEDDYTYFGDLNTASFGSDSVPVNGYARLSDSTLVVYKAETAQDASIFYVNGSYRTTYDTNGNIDSIRGEFPHSAGSIGEGVVSRYACVNFAGDNIILSRNGVFGIVLAENVATTERYTRERSRSINEKLKTHEDLSEAVGIVYKNRYYLALDNVCYIADSRYKYTREDDIDGSYNYEWWYWDNVPVRVWANIDNNLYFGTAEGQICVFDDEYTDRTYQHSKSGELGLDISNNKVSYSNTIGINLAEGDSITFTTEGLYALVQDDAVVENGRIKSTEGDIFTFHDGMEVYADNEGASGLSIGKKYYIREVDTGECTYSLEDDDGEIVTLASGGFRLYKSISNNELYLTNVTEDSFQVRDYKVGDVLVLARYNDSIPTNPLADFVHRENVVAEWYTPILDLGTNESSKTLLKMTISTEPEVNGKLSFGYETRNVNKLINAKGINVFSFDNFSFENFSFDTGFANSYSVKANERNFNFIVFRFVSDNDSNCIVNTFTIIYKINKANKGVK